MQKSEKFLITTAVAMFAVIIGYNAFFVPEVKVSLPNPVQDSFKEDPQKPELVNINTANSEQLQTLNGVGKVVAGRIIEYRETHGGFASTEEIMEVKGIGEKIFERLKNHIKV